MSAYSAEQLQKQKLQEAIKNLRGEGWEVETEPSRSIPELGNYRPDFIARLGDQIIVGEVKYPHEPQLDQLQDLAKRVQAIANARLDVIWVGEPEEEPTVESVALLAARAHKLIPIDTTAALLLGWAALSGGLETQQSQDVASKRRTSARQKLAEMASLGLLSETQFNRLNEASHVRNRVAHGEYVQPEPDLVEYVCTVAAALASASFVSVDRMIELFFENYKDPAEGVPFDTREGGYQYFAGGPYDAQDVLIGKFPQMSHEDIDEAVRQIEQIGYEWVRREDY
jgi:hypothetical protein